MKQGDEVDILNSTDTDEVFARKLEEQINTSDPMSSAFISNDEAIARELQGQIDFEYNQNLRRLEKLQNGTSKLNISYEKYRKYENYDDYGEEPLEDCDQQDNVDWDRFEAVDRTFNSIPPCGYLFTKNGNVVTKHDVSLNGQRNMKRLMNLPPNVQTGDGAASHMEISNSVLNGLKRHSQNETHRENVRRKEKDEANLRKLNKIKKTNLLGVDQSTNDIVIGLFEGEEPYLKQLFGKIGEGKESVIYHGETADTHEGTSCECALKLYKLDAHDFKSQEKYISDDHRYKDRYNSKMNRRRIICLWAEKERDNLIRLKRHNIPCPEVITLKNNVLVMSLIGNNHMPATKLKYANMMTVQKYKDAYKQVVEHMTNMYKNALLIHADLSEYNILWHQEKCYFVDVSQAVEPGHEGAFEYLMRDCTNVIEFFNKKKVTNMMTKEELFKHITGRGYNDKIGLEHLENSFKNKRRSKPDDTSNRFEALWEMSKSKTANI